MMLEEQIQLLKHLAKALAIQFGDKCEVAVHDLTRDPETTIVAIENGHISGRRVGDGASLIVLDALKSGKKVEDNLGYLTRTRDGRTLKSSSIYIYNAEGHPAALFSINYDITDLTVASSILAGFISSTQIQNQDNINEIFPSVNDLLDRLLEESAAHVGKPVAMMNKDDKVKALRYLEQKGAFLVKKSGDKIAKFYDISKYTLYNYLDIPAEH